MRLRRIVPAPSADGSERNPHNIVFDDVYRNHADFVWRLVRRHGVPADAAEDLVHEVFLVIHRRLAQYDGRASLRSWIYMLARGVMANQRRKIARAQGQRLPQPPAGIDPEQHARQGEAAAFVRDFLQTLDPHKREVFVLSDVEGMRGPEIAAALGVNLNTVYARIAAARKALQGMLDEYLAREERR